MPDQAVRVYVWESKHTVTHTYDLVSLDGSLCMLHAGELLHARALHGLGGGEGPARVQAFSAPRILKLDGYAASVYNKWDDVLWIRVENDGFVALKAVICAGRLLKAFPTGFAWMGETVTLGARAMDSLPVREFLDVPLTWAF